MHKKIFMSLLGISAFFILSSQLVSAQNIQSSFEVKPASAPTQPYITTDNLQEFIQQQNKEISEFKKRKQEELRQKIAEIQSQKKACATKIKAYTLERKTARALLVKSCLPTPSPTIALTTEETKTRIAQKQALTLACREKIATFDTETKIGLSVIRSECFTTERQVLGLSTLVPYNEQ